MCPIEMVYQFRVKGVLEARWSAWFAPLEIFSQADETLIAGPIRDQSELFGTLLKIRDMGLPLVSVTQARRLAFSMPFPQLTTERLLLREFNPGDAPMVLDILRCPEVNQWLETDPLESIEEAQVRIRARMGLFSDGTGLRWAITLREQPEQVIGSCGFFSVRRGT
ncbi:MAG: GNAT family N-acetyltransferase, partial [Anaerolineales bacterium]|nr:GNAT family N-acetyltransferase [Anaerolineales bacterium]